MIAGWDLCCPSVPQIPQSHDKHNWSVSCKISVNSALQGGTANLVGWSMRWNWADLPQLQHLSYMGERLLNPADITIKEQELLTSLRSKNSSGGHTITRIFFLKITFSLVTFVAHSNNSYKVWNLFCHLCNLSSLFSRSFPRVQIHTFIHKGKYIIVKQ